MTAAIICTTHGHAGTIADEYTGLITTVQYCTYEAVSSSKKLQPNIIVRQYSRVLSKHGLLACVYAFACRSRRLVCHGCPYGHCSICKGRLNPRIAAKDGPAVAYC